MNIDYKKPLNEKFIRENKNEIDWNYISYYQKLSEDFIREFKDKVDWFYISQFQKLSEDFIREFQDKVNWFSISFAQNLSENFIKEFQNKINWKLLLKKHGYSLINFDYNFQVVYDDISCYVKIISNNYNSDYLQCSEFVNLTLRLISLKACQ